MSKRIIINLLKSQKSKLTIVGGAECVPLQIRKVQTRRRDFTLHCKTPTARQGQGHCTHHTNSRKKSQTIQKWPILFNFSHNMDLNFIETHDLHSFQTRSWPYFWPFLAFFLGAMHSMQTFALGLPDCSRKLRRRRWRLWRKFCAFWH